MFYSIKDLAELTGIAEKTFKKAIENGEIIPAYFGENEGKTKISLLEYNRWAISIQYKNHPKLMESAMNCLDLNISVSNG